MDRAEYLKDRKMAARAVVRKIGYQFGDDPANKTPWEKFYFHMLGHAIIELTYPVSIREPTGRSKMMAYDVNENIRNRARSWLLGDMHQVADWVDPDWVRKLLREVELLD
jgi:hypothetical protein